MDSLSARKDFKKAGFSMDGFILTTTPLAQIPGADSKTWQELTRDYQVMDQTALDLPTLLGMPA